MKFPDYPRSGGSIMETVTQLMDWCRANNITGVTGGRIHGHTGGKTIHLGKNLPAAGAAGGFTVTPPLHFVTAKPGYVPEPEEPVASGFARFFLTWGTTQGVLADNWFNCVDIPSAPETLRHVAMKAYLSPTAEEVVVTNCEWITFTEEQRLTTPYQTPEFGSDGSRPEFLIIPMGQLYISAEGAPLAGNNGGGSFLIREHVASIKFESGAATYQKSINAERLVY